MQSVLKKKRKRCGGKDCRKRTCRGYVQCLAERVPAMTAVVDFAELVTKLLALGQLNTRTHFHHRGTPKLLALAKTGHPKRYTSTSTLALMAVQPSSQHTSNNEVHPNSHLCQGSTLKLLALTVHSQQVGTPKLTPLPKRHTQAHPPPRRYVHSSW